MQLPQTLSQLLSEANRQQAYLKAFSEGSKLYYLTPYKLGKITPNKIIRLYRKLCKRYYQSYWMPTNHWHENQLKIFVWTLINYGFLKKKNIQSMNTEDFILIASIFNNRSLDLIEFQAKSLIRLPKRKNPWDAQQIQILTELIQNNQKPRWNQIALQFYIKSQKKFFRTAKQCREQWVNHIDPSKDKSQWQLCQQIILFESVSQIGRKWSEIAKFLGSTRTQHMVKNRFHSILNIYQKKSLKCSQQRLIETILQDLLNQRKKNISKIQVSNKSKAVAINKDQNDKEQLNLQQNSLQQEKQYSSDNDGIKEKVKNTNGYDLLTNGYDLLTNGYNLLTSGYNLLTNGQQEEISLYFQ